MKKSGIEGPIKQNFFKKKNKKMILNDHIIYLKLQPGNVMDKLKKYLETNQKPV